MSQLQIRQLFDGCRRGEIEKVKELFMLGVNANVVDDVGRTAGHHAARNGRVNILRLLHKNGANLNQSTVRGITPAHQAAYSGHVGFLKELVDLGWRVDFTDTYEFTPLEVAIELGNTPVIRFLEQIYAKIPDISYETPNPTTFMDPPSNLPSFEDWYPCTTPVEIVAKPEPTIDVIAEGPWGGSNEMSQPKKRKRAVTADGIASLLNAGRELLIEKPCQTEVESFFK